MTRRRYSKAEKAAAVITAEMTSPTAAAQAHGIPENTLRYWVESPQFADLRAKTRAESAAGFTVLMHLAQARLAQLIPTMEPRDLVMLMGVATDKSQLLAGEATSRSESVALTDGLDPDDKRRLREIVDRAVAAEAEVGPPG